MGIDYEEFDRMVNETESLDELLNRKGITKEQALQAADTYKNSVMNAIKNVFPDSAHKALLIEKICNHIDNGDAEKLKLLCDIAADTGLLLGDYDEEDTIFKWAGSKELSETLFRLIETRKEKVCHYREIANCTAKNKEEIGGSEEVFNLLVENGYAEDCDNLSILKDNLSAVENAIGSLTGFDEIAPFVYFQLLVRNANKMLNKEDYFFNPKSIFIYKNYTIDKDNGKNFDQYTDYCTLYADLCDLFPKSDKELCDVCFLLTSNLGEWIAENIESDCLPIYFGSYYDSLCISTFDKGIYEFEEIIPTIPEYEETALFERRNPAIKKEIRNIIKGKTTAELLTKTDKIIKELISAVSVSPDKLDCFTALCCETIIGIVDERYNNAIKETVKKYISGNGNALISEII